MIYVLVLVSYLNVVPVNVYEVGPEFIDKQSCESFGKSLPRTKYNSFVCLPISDIK